LKGAGPFSFVQISDTHIGFSKPANSDTAATLRETIAKIHALPQRPDQVIHTGDVTHLSTTEQFDTARQLLCELGLPLSIRIPSCIGSAGTAEAADGSVLMGAASTSSASSKCLSLAIGTWARWEPSKSPRSKKISPPATERQRARSVYGRSPRLQAIPSSERGSARTAWDASRSTNTKAPPNRGFVGLKAGSVQGYAYFAAFKRSRIVRTPDQLDRWLSGRQALVPGAKMYFLVANPRNRGDIIARSRNDPSMKDHP
jgi:hypothetical protein